MTGFNREERAYIGPFCAFLGFLLLAEIIGTIGNGYAWWPAAEPRYWVFPVQTLVCAWLVWRWRELHDYGPARGFVTATVIGAAIIAIWVAPQWLLGFESRKEGFDPAFFATEGPAYWANVIIRVFRMVVIVPLVEEIFWRGFLLRWLVKEDFRSVPFGTFTLKSFLITSAAFCLEHQFADWPASIVAGALFNLVAYRTRSLLACIVCHAVANAILAAYILHTGQYGFW